MTYSQGRGSGSRLDNRRALAAVVDLAVIAAGGLLISLAAGGDFTGPIAAVSIGWALFYYFAFESDGGQTLGKRLLKLRVERATGGPAAPRDIAVRTGLRLVDGLGLYLVGLGVMLFTRERRQRLGDLAAKTVVVDVTEPAVVPVARGAAEEAPAQKAPAEDAPAAPRVTLPSTGSTSEWEISDRVAGPTELPMAELPAADEPAVDETQAVDPT
nr:RDD family protein [Thermoleophilaceae bacterium]